MTHRPLLACAVVAIGSAMAPADAYATSCIDPVVTTVDLEFVSLERLEGTGDEVDERDRVGTTPFVVSYGVADRDAGTHARQVDLITASGTVSFEATP